MGQRDNVLYRSAQPQYRPAAAGIIEGTLDGHSPEINGGFVREDAMAMQPGSGNDDVAPALILAQQCGVLVEQR